MCESFCSKNSLVYGPTQQHITEFRFKEKEGKIRAVVIVRTNLRPLTSAIPNPTL